MIKASIREPDVDASRAHSNAVLMRHGNDVPGAMSVLQVCVVTYPRAAQKLYAARFPLMSSTAALMALTRASRSWRSASSRA